MQEVLNAGELRGGGGPRGRVARLVSAPAFQRTVIALVLLNALLLGVETSATALERWGTALDWADRLLLWLFTAELALRLYAFRGRFLRDPWGLFDLAVVAIAWVPSSGPLAVLRALRVLRVLRLVSAMPSLRVVVEAMLAALPGMGSIVLLMGLIFYVCAVMATRLFGDTQPEQFGTLGASLFTLFQLMTLENWVDGIVGPAMAESAWSLLFFLPFMIVATFVVLNLFIGVIVDSIQGLREERGDTAAARAEAAAESAEAASAADTRAVLAELRALRAEVAALREASARR